VSNFFASLILWVMLELSMLFYTVRPLLRSSTITQQQQQQGVQAVPVPPVPCCFVTVHFMFMCWLQGQNQLVKMLDLMEKMDVYQTVFQQGTTVDCVLSVH
jgi:hypothetical protein